MKARAPKFDRFKTAAPKPVTLSGADLVRTGPLESADPMPLVVQPAIEDVDLADWAASSRDFLEAKLRWHGALLFRGFGVPTVGEFERFAAAVCPELFGEYADLPSENEGQKVYRSTPYPPDKVILFHNESSHMHQWPRKQWFYCVQAARERGETPIVDCRAIYRELEPEIRQRFEEQGLLYVRTFVESLDVPWQSFFKTGDREAVSAYCQRAGIEHEWLADGGLRTRQRCPAVITHPVTGEKVFFNQIQLHHAWFLEPEVRRSLIDLYGEENLPRNVYYGDGSPIEDPVAERIEQLYWQQSVQFPWREQDVLMVDNMLVAHARNPYVGQRRIAVAMGEMVQREAVA